MVWNGVPESIEGEEADVGLRGGGLAMSAAGRWPGRAIAKPRGQCCTMLIDGRTLPAGEVLETDLCILGAGAAGITLALAFADDPDIDVCLMESGGFEFDAAVQELYRGETRGVAYEAYDTRMRMFGGSTNVSPDSGAVFQGLCFDEDRAIPVIREFSERIHRHGAALMCQLTHLGGRSHWRSGSWHSAPRADTPRNF